MSDDTPVSREELLNRLQKGWDEFQSYLQTLSEAQLTGPRDAAGWTAKDHIMHLVVWEDGAEAALARESRWARMGLDRELFASGDFDRMNAIIQARHRDMPLAEVLAAFRRVHERLVARISSMSTEDLLLPYRIYQPDSDSTRPVIGTVVGNTFEHYAEHQPWIAAIIDSAAT